MAANSRYQWTLVLLLSFNFGVVFFDRNAFNFLVPFIAPDLGLNNTQIGLIGAGLSFSWALAGLFIGRLSDLIGRRKAILVVCTLAFSAASVLSGYAMGFVALLATRLLMGIAEGGIMPISQTLIAAEVDPARRGLAQGLAQNFGANIIANSLGPIVIVAVATAVGWRNAFMLAALPGFLMALLIAWLVREPPQAEQSARAAPGDFGRLLRQPDILRCVLVSVLLVAYLVVFSLFTPQYLVQARGIAPQSMGWIMSTFGFASIAIAFLVPGSSDYFGRRPVCLAAALLGIVLPAGLLLTSGATEWPIIAVIAIGAAFSGLFPLVMATIPSELVGAGRAATAMSLTMGISEIVGGVLAPSLTGVAADAYGLGAVVWIMLGLAVAIFLLAFTLPETAPAVLARTRSSTGT
jgi:MFS transporter, ACS family, hexuronate transporter